MNRDRGFSFTLFNYTDGDLDRLNTIECVYLIYGKETCPETKKPYLQGYIYFKNPRRLSSLCKLFPWRIYAAKASATANYMYCTKEDPSPIERGIRPLSDSEKGNIQKECFKRTREFAIKGDFNSIDDSHYLRYYNTIKRIHKDDGRSKPQHLPEADYYGLWFFGEPRTGKSTKARTDYPEAYLKDKNKWWDGYHDQDYVIIDEIDKSDNWICAFLKKWVDRWTFSAEYKGGTMLIRPKLFIITSNYHPDDIFNGVDLEAIKSRFKTIEFKKLI